MRLLFAPASHRCDRIEGPLRAVGVDVQVVRYKPAGSLSRMSAAGRTILSSMFSRADILFTDMCSSPALAPTLPGTFRRWPMVLRPRADSWQEIEDLRRQGRSGLLRNVFEPHLSNYFYRRATAILPVSESLREPIVKNTGVDPERITPIPIPVNSVRFAPASDPEAVKRELQLPYEHIVSLATGFEFVQKVEGLTLFLPALRALLDDHQDVAVIIAGDGRLRAGFQRDNQAVLDHPRLLIPGRVTDIQKLYQCSDLLAHFSFFDACPNVLMEAWASGTPVIVNDYPAFREHLRPGENGYIVPADGDVDETVATLERVIYDVGHRRALGENGRGMAVEELSEVAIGRRFLSVLESIVAQATSPVQS